MPKLIPLFIILAICQSCNYDPPVKGITLIVENQTMQGIVIADSLANGSRCFLYDTMLVNGHTIIAAKSNYLPPFFNSNHFLSARYLQSRKEQGYQTISIYFVPETGFNTTFDSIRSTHNFRQVTLQVPKLSYDSVYRIFIWKDSISVTTNHDLAKIKSL